MRPGAQRTAPHRPYGGGGQPTLSRCLARWGDRGLVSGGRHYAEVESPRGAVVVVVGPVGPGVEHDWQALAGTGTGDELRPPGPSKPAPTLRAGWLCLTHGPTGEVHQTAPTV
jgi:hypothetical protein